MILLCGLGNPGRKYANTRHNVGFRFINTFAEKHDFGEFKEKWEAVVSEGSWLGEKTLIIKPLTFMNLSGRAVAKFANFYKIPAENVVLIYDDVDLPVGEIRIRKKGSAGTHNGMRSVIEHLGTQEFPRLRIGIESRGRFAPEQMGLSDFVLSPIGEEENQLIDESIATGMSELEKTLAS